MSEKKKRKPFFKDRSKILTKTFKTEIFLSEEDKRVLDSASKICNWLYNNLLQASNDDYENNGNQKKLTNRISLRDYMVNKVKPANPFLKTVHSSLLKEPPIRLGSAFQAFFKLRAGKPGFKSWKKQWFSLVYDEPSSGSVKINGKQISFNIGKDINGKKIVVNAEMDCAITYKNYKLCTVEITKERDRFFVCISVDIPKKEVNEDIKSWICIDPNHKNLFVAIDNEGRTYEFGNPTPSKSLDKEIDKVKAKLSKTRKQKVVKEYNEKGEYVKTNITPASRRNVHLQDVLEHLYHKRREQNKQLYYGVCNWISNKYDFVVIGDYTPSADLTISTAMRRVMLAQSHVGKFRDTLEFVCAKNGVKYKATNEAYTTSDCCICGHRKSRTPDERNLVCEKCGQSVYRDVNSCINFAINENLILSGSDYEGVDLSKPSYTFFLNQKTKSVSDLVEKRLRIKEVNQIHLAKSINC